MDITINMFTRENYSRARARKGSLLLNNPAIPSTPFNHTPSSPHPQSRGGVNFIHTDKKPFILFFSI